MEPFCTEEEFLEIVVDGEKRVFDEVLSRVFIKGVETALLYLPEAVDKLSKRLAHTTKIFTAFLEKHPEYKENKDIVLKIVQSTELNNPLKTMEEVLEIAAPEIDRQIDLITKIKEKF